MAEPLHLVGGSIACLVAALAAAPSREVRLYANPAAAGGGFGGMKWGGLRLNLGMRLLELDYEDPPTARRPLSAYDPAIDDHRPYIDHVRGFLRQLAGEAFVPVVPEMLVNGCRATCALTTADLAVLPALLPPSLRVRIAGEAAQLLAQPDPPAWRALPGSPARLEGVSLEAASRDNHGETLHAMLVAPIMARLDAGWAACPAIARRKLWAALFHPVTVLEAFQDGHTTFRPHRPFATVRGGGMAGLVARMLAALAALPQVRVHPVGRLQQVRRRGDRLLLRFAALPGAIASGEVSLPAATTALGLGAEEAFAAAGLAYAPVRLRAGFAWAAMAERDLLHNPAALLLCDATAPAFRISDNGAMPADHSAGTSQRLLMIEFGHRLAAPGESEVRTVLENTGLLRPGAGLRLMHALAGPAQVAPHVDNQVGHAAAAAGLAAVLGVGPRILGGARRFCFESFNDQVVDGLHTGEHPW
jgi:hypothetical protein